MANTFNWQLGHEGKGNVYDDGSISTWNVDKTRSPHHFEKGNEDEKTPRFHFYLTPEGGLHDGGTDFQNQTPRTDDQIVKDVAEQHPAVYDARHEMDDVDWDEEPEERVEMPGGGYGHAEELMRLTASDKSGWASFHTELKLPRGIRKKIRRWVDRLEWPEGHSKEDARRYHITILSMDEYDEKFAKWARQEIRGRVFSFKTTGMDIFADEHVVLRMDCPEWTELVKEWQEVADDKGLEPRKFDPPKAHVTIGKSPEGKWPQGIPNPHIKFDTRMFNINKNSMAADPDWVNQWIQDNGPYLYHGAESRSGVDPEQVARQIEQQGIVPQGDKRVMDEYPGFDEDNEAGLLNWWQTPRAGHTYLSTSPEGAFGNPTFKVDLRKLDPNKLKADEDLMEDNGLPTFGPMSNPATEGEPRTLGEQAETIGWGDDPEDTRESLEGRGTIAHEGPIPPEAIERYDGLNKNSAAGDPWQPGVWGKGLVYDEKPIVWETGSPHEGEMEPIHPQYGWQNFQRYPTQANAPVVVSPEGHYAPAPHWEALKDIERPVSDPLLQKEREALNQRFNVYEQHPNMTRISPDAWEEKMQRGQVPYEGYGHARNVLDILNKRGMAVDPEWLDKWTEPNPYLYNGRQEHPDMVYKYGIDGSWGSYYPTPSVYLTDQQELAEHFAQHPGIEAEPGEFESHPGNWVYKIDPRKLDPSKLDADEWNVEHYPEGHEYHGEDYSVTPELEKHLADPATVHNQWEKGKPLAYRGTIPPEAIVDHYEMPDNNPRPWLNGMRGSAVESAPDDDLKAWLDSFTPEQEQAPPSLHHTDADQFTPQVVAPVVTTPHVDPPSKPYAPYNWAEEGWEESPLDRTAASPEEEMYVPGMARPPVTINPIGWPQSSAKTNMWNYEPQEHEPSRTPFLFNRNTRTIHLGRPGMIHSEIYDAAGVPSEGDVGGEWSQGELKHHPAEFKYKNEPSWFTYGNPLRPDPDRDDIYAAVQKHVGEPLRDIDAEAHTSTIDTHICSQCGEESDAPICANCGYDPQNSPDSYKQMKTDWYDRAWAVPGNQPQPTPHELHPQHWRDDHAKNVSLASADAQYLPIEDELYYRAHHIDAPFGTEHAYSTPIEGADIPEQYTVPKEGYSAFWNPHHLGQYMDEMGWDTEPRQVVAFRGKAVGGGTDGEPLVMPHSDQPESTIPYQDFLHRLEYTPNGYGRWHEHTWGDGPNGQQVDDGYRSLGEIGSNRKETNDGHTNSRRWNVSDEFSAWGPINDLSSLRDRESSSIKTDQKEDRGSLPGLLDYPR